MHQWRSGRSPSFALLTGAIALIAICGPASAAIDLKVMSFNVRVGSANDGVNSWDNRKDYAVQVVEDYTPDILGLQEDLGYQASYLKNNLTTEYTRFWRGVNADNSGENVSVLYKTSRFTKITSGSYWLSTTPNTPGSQSWGADFPRIVNWVKLADNDNPGFEFVVMNTHWEHAAGGATARFESAKLMRSKIHELFQDIPVIATGDFNADEGATAYERMTGNDDADTVRTLQDTYKNKHPGNSATVGTAHGFDGTAGSGRIDWILHDNDFTTIFANIVETSFNGKYPSDHFPITARIQPDFDGNAIPEPVGSATCGVIASGLLLRRRRERR